MDKSWYESLLERFRRVPAPGVASPTLLEIAGYPHLENVCSNILAFFLHPKGPHGLGTLFIDALLSASCKSDVGRVCSDRVSVRREETTRHGNRVDIVVESDAFVMEIENKIYASELNPFADYAAHASALAGPGRAQIKVLLTLSPSSSTPDHGFVNVTHAEFTASVRRLLGNFVANANTRYLVYMLDYLRTMEGLQMRETIDDAFLGFVASNESEIDRLLTSLRVLREELRRKTSALAEMIDARTLSNVNQWFWREGWSPRDIVVHDVALKSGLVVAVDTILSASGWEVQFFARRGGTASDVCSLLDRLGVDYLERPRLIWTTHFPYEQDLGRVAEEVSRLIRSIATSDGEVHASGNASS